MERLDSLYDRWRQIGDLRCRDKALASLLGGSLGKTGKIPRFCSRTSDAQRAMDRAWAHLEENAPYRVSCSDSGRKCRVEWWPDEDEHLVTPLFSTEAESRAFAAFAFTMLEIKTE
ncbi:MAG: hypothetical protein HQL50_04460 [Magnetococcales bacterium]|nr:hypothetical protein [Magnetococcales bacterium]